jgi:glutathione synthase/RimK-type ligase-like ATP-grasp enzyme
MILIISVKNDIHSLEVQRRIKDAGYGECYIVESDLIAGKNGLHIEIYDRGSREEILTREGKRVKLDDVKVVWLRRVSSTQRYIDQYSSENVGKLINHDCGDAFWACLELGFRGKWISSPSATKNASNKLIQLAIASECGFRVPHTIVSQSKSSVCDFFLTHPRGVIVKSISGVSGKILLTQILRNPQAIEESSYEACPTLFQEFIPGNRHIRLHCFGAESHAVLLFTDHVDSRINLNISMQMWNVPDQTHKAVRRVLDALRLEMGIIDLKETPDGELVWLEVNPQGQFLYLEPLSELRLGDVFTQYLLNECRQ